MNIINIIFYRLIAVQYGDSQFLSLKQYRILKKWSPLGIKHRTAFCHYDNQLANKHFDSVFILLRWVEIKEDSQVKTFYILSWLSISLRLLIESICSQLIQFIDNQLSINILLIALSHVSQLVPFTILVPHSCKSWQSCSYECIRTYVGSVIVRLQLVPRTQKCTHTCTDNSTAANSGLKQQTYF